MCIRDRRNTADKILAELEDNTSLLSTVYGNMYVNPRTNTLYLVLTTDEPDIKNAILSMVSPSKDVTIEFRKGPATYKELDEWYEKGNKLLPSLREKGVEIGFWGITENATLLMEVVTINPYIIETIENEIENVIPKGLVSIRLGGMAEPAWSRSDRIRPVLGALKVTSYDDQWWYSTLGFYATNDENVEGVLVSGHATDLNEEVYQVAIDNNNIIGTTADDDEGAYADVAWVPLDVAGVPKVFNLTSLQHVVTGEKWYTSMILGETIEGQGYVSGSISGDITQKGTTYHDEWDQDMYGQVRYDDVIVDGDSGGPVYIESWNQGNYRYEVTAYGVNWGVNSVWGWSVFSPVNGIEIQVGSLDFT